MHLTRPLDRNSTDRERTDALATFGSYIEAPKGGFGNLGYATAIVAGIFIVDYTLTSIDNWTIQEYEKLQQKKEQIRPERPQQNTPSQSIKDRESHLA